MFDLGRQNYLIPLPPAEAKTKASTQVESQLRKHFCEQERRNINKQGQKKQSWKRGKWTLRQKMRYLLFLEEHIDLFVDSQARKKYKIFSKMAKQIKSRGTAQCKSHHQKVLKVHKSEQAIVAFLRRSLNPLKAEWRQFIRTEERVLLNSHSQINNRQHFYKIHEYSDTIRIEIDTDYMQSYQ